MQCERLDQHAGGEEERLAVGDGGVALEAEQGREVRRVLLGGGRPGKIGDGSRELPARRLGVVAVEDPGDLLDLLDERAVRRAGAVGRRAAADDAPALRRDELRQLV